MTLAPLTSGPWQAPDDTQFEVQFASSETDTDKAVEIRTYEVKLAGVTLWADQFMVNARHAHIGIPPDALERAAVHHVMTTFALRLADVLAPKPPAAPEPADDANGYACCRHCSLADAPGGRHIGGHEKPCTQGCQP